VEPTVYNWSMATAPVAVVAQQFPIPTETVCRSVEMRIVAQHYKALSEEERAQARELQFRLRLDRAYWKAVN